MTAGLKMLCSGVALATVLGLSNPAAAELPSWLLGRWTGQRGDGTLLTLTWAAHGATLDGVLEETNSGGPKELRRYSIGTRVPVARAFRPYSLSLRISADRAQYLFAGYSGSPRTDHVRFDRILKSSGVNRSSYIAITEISLVEGQLIVVEMMGPQHGAMPERRWSFQRSPQVPP